ncbi:MAG TPA: hypothetical protein VI685_00650 [Candidatus Angelobacter sp.]
MEVKVVVAGPEAVAAGEEAVVQAANSTDFEKTGWEPRYSALSSLLHIQ